MEYRTICIFWFCFSFFLENQECSQCKALEEECNLLTTEKDFFKEKKEKFEDEVKKLSKEMKELRSDHLREKQALQKEIQSMREEHEKLSRDFEKELHKMLRDVNEKQESEMKAALQGQNDELNDQINKLKSEIQKVMAQLKKEKSQLEKNQEDLAKAKKNLAREKKKLKETKEELGTEVNAKKDALKELTTLKNEVCSQEKKRSEDIERLRKDFAESCKCDLLREEIQRLRNMSGRKFHTVYELLLTKCEVNKLAATSKVLDKGDRISVIGYMFNSFSGM